MKHKITEGLFTAKNGKITNYKCGGCYGKWVNKPTTDCGGNPFDKMNKSTGTKPTSPKKPTTRKPSKPKIEEVDASKYKTVVRAQMEKGTFITKRELRERKARLTTEVQHR